MPEPENVRIRSEPADRLPRLRHDAARRRPAGGPEPLGPRQAAHRAAHRRSRCRLHRGRLAGRQPQGHGVLPAGPRGARPRARPADGLRRHPPGRGRRGRRPARGGPARQRRRGGDPGGQVPRPARRAGAAHHARGEPRDGARHRVPPARRGAAGVPRRRALLRRLPRQPRLRPRGAPGGGRGGRRRRRAVRHQRRHAAGLGRRRGAGRAGEHRREGRDPLPQRHRLRGGQLAGRGRRRRHPRAGHAQRLRRAHRQRRPGLGGRQPRAQARPPGPAQRQPARGDPHRPRGRGGHQRAAVGPAALRRGERLRPQGRPARLARSRSTRTSTSTWTPRTSATT